MPDRTTVWDWTKTNSEFSQRIARAREDGFDCIAHDCLEIADETGRDTKFTEHGEVPDGEWISRSRLRVETRLKLLAKWDPRRYGDKVEHEVSGSVQVQKIKRVIVDSGNGTHH